MALIRTLPPLGRRLNYASPFARGLVLATLPYDWQGDSTGPQGPGAVAGTLALKDATGGRAIDFAAGGSLTFPRAPYLPPPFTVLVAYTPVSGYGQSLLSCGTASDGWMIYQGNSNGLDLSMYRFGKSVDTFGVSITPGVPIVLGFTFDPSLVTNVYVNGARTGGGAPGSLPFVSAATLEIGNVSQGGYALKGALHFALAYNRVLSGAEIASLSEDPYRILTKPRLLFAPASAGPQAVTALAAAATFTALAGTVSLGAVSVTPAPATSSWTALAPSAAVGPATAAPSAATGTFTALAPTRAVGAVVVTPSAAASAWSVPAPSITLGSLTRTPAPAVSTWTANDASVAGSGQTATPTPAVATWTGLAPAIALGSVAASPSPASATWAALSPTITLGAAVVQPSPAVSTWTALPASTNGSVVASPGPAVAAWTALSPTRAVGAITVQPASAVSTWAALAPTRSVGAVQRSATAAASTWTALDATAIDHGQQIRVRITAAVQARHRIALLVQSRHRIATLIQ